MVVFDLADGTSWQVMISIVGWASRSGRIPRTFQVGASLPARCVGRGDVADQRVDVNVTSTIVLAEFTDAVPSLWARRWDSRGEVFVDSRWCRRRGGRCCEAVTSCTARPRRRATARNGLERCSAQASGVCGDDGSPRRTICELRFQFAGEGVDLLAIRSGAPLMGVQYEIAVPAREGAHVRSRRNPP